MTRAEERREDFCCFFHFSAFDIFLLIKPAEANVECEALSIRPETVLFLSLPSPAVPSAPLLPSTCTLPSPASDSQPTGL